MEVDEVVRDILSPLLRADGGDIELVRAEGSEVVIILSGSAAFGAGAHYVRSHVVEPALREALGPDIRVLYEKQVPKAAKRDSTPEPPSE